MNECFVLNKYGNVSIQGDIKGISKKDLNIFESIVFKNKDTIDSLNIKFKDKKISIKYYIMSYIDEELEKICDF